MLGGFRRRRCRHTGNPRADTPQIHPATCARLRPLANPIRPWNTHRGRIRAPICWRSSTGRSRLCTLVPGSSGPRSPSMPGGAGSASRSTLRDEHVRLRAQGIRVSLFCDPEPASIRLACRWDPNSGRALHRRSPAGSVRAGGESSARSFERLCCCRSGVSSSAWASTPATQFSTSTPCFGSFRSCAHLAVQWPRHHVPARSLPPLAVHRGVLVPSSRRAASRLADRLPSEKAPFVMPRRLSSANDQHRTMPPPARNIEPSLTPSYEPWAMKS